jgi:hypothetical protein
VTDLAHFTLMELPGTAAIWVAGIGLGLAMASGSRRAAPPLVLMAAFAGLAMLGDAMSWADWVAIAVDAAFLLMAAVLAAILLSERRSAPSRS